MLLQDIENLLPGYFILGHPVVCVCVCGRSDRILLQDVITGFDSRSFCCTVWSAVGIILLSVCPSAVCLSVCLWRCALWLSGSVYRAKSCSSVFLAWKFLFVPSDTFAVGCIV